MAGTQKLETADTQASKHAEQSHPVQAQMACDNQAGRFFHQTQNLDQKCQEALPGAAIDEKKGSIIFTPTEPSAKNAAKVNGKEAESPEKVGQNSSTKNKGAAVDSSSNQHIRMPGGTIPLFERPGADLTPKNLILDGKLPLSDGTVINLNVMSVSKNEYNLPSGARLDTTFNWQSLTMADGTRLTLDNINFKEVSSRNSELQNYAPMDTPNRAHGLPLLINGRDGTGDIGAEVTLKGKIAEGKPGEFPSEFGFGTHELSNGAKLTIQKSDRGEGPPDKAVYTPVPGSNQVEVAFDSMGVLSVGNKVLRQQKPRDQQLYDQLSKNYEQAKNHQRPEASQSRSNDYGYKAINFAIASRLPGESPETTSFSIDDLVRAHDQLFNAKVTIDSPRDEMFYLGKEQELKAAKGGQLTDADYAQILKQTIDRRPGRGHLIDKPLSSAAKADPETISFLTDDVRTGNMKRLAFDTENIGWKSLTETYAPAMQKALDDAGYNIGVSASKQDASKGDFYIYNKPGIDQCTGGTAITPEGIQAVSFENRDGKIIGPGDEVLKDAPRLSPLSSADFSWSHSFSRHGS